MEQKSSKGLIITIVILLIGLITLGGYVVYEKFFEKEDKTVEKDSNKTMNKEEKIINYETGLSVIDSVYNKTKLNGVPFDSPLLSNLKTGLTKDMDDWMKISIAFISAQTAGIYGESIYCKSNELNDQPANCINNNIIDQQIHLIFGKNISTNHNNYKQFEENPVNLFGGSITYDKENKEYRTPPMPATGGMISYGYSLVPYELKIENNEFVISAYLKYAVPGDKMEEYGQGEYLYTYYTSADKKTLLYENNDENISEKAEIDKLLSSSNIKKATKIEFVFKEDSNGDVNWIETIRTN
jgi:hypothetical protein